MQIEFSPQFKLAFDLMEHTNKNIFLTGKAGTGKSTLLKYFIEETKKNVAVLAPTGVAALNIEGETIHSFFNFPPNLTFKEVEKKALHNIDSDLYKNLQTIVLDEVSMVRADMMDYIDYYLQKVRKSHEPFGGVQMVFIGDLYQLPPVVTSEERDYIQETYGSPYFFDSKSIKNPKFQMEFIELEKIYRQKDQNFIELLNAIRNNSITTEQIETLNTCVNPQFENKNSNYISLTTTNAIAREINEKRLRGLKTKPSVFEAKIEGQFDFKDYPTDSTLILKQGAQIMFLNNDPAGYWVNGTIGKILKIYNEENLLVQIKDGAKVEVSSYAWKIYKYAYDKKTKHLTQEKAGSFHQIPLKLAWAITIHKSQGKSFDNVILDIGNGTFAHGQTYVGLSRCRSFKGLVLRKPLKKHHIIMDWRVVRFLTEYQYKISEQSCCLTEKINLLKQSLQENKELEIIYLKSGDEKSTRKIKVLEIGKMKYQNKTFPGIRAYCFTRKTERTFRIDRILEIKQ